MPVTQLSANNAPTCQQRAVLSDLNILHRKYLIILIIKITVMEFVTDFKTVVQSHKVNHTMDL